MLYSFSYSLFSPLIVLYTLVWCTLSSLTCHKIHFLLGLIYLKYSVPIYIYTQNETHNVQELRPFHGGAEVELSRVYPGWAGGLACGGSLAGDIGESSVCFGFVLGAGAHTQGSGPGLSLPLKFNRSSGFRPFFCLSNWFVHLGVTSECLLTRSTPNKILYF